MVMARNLFFVDLNGVRTTLEDANRSLARSVTAYSARVQEILHPGAQTDGTKLTEARDAVRSKMQEVRSARLSDSRSFRDATKLIEAWFKPLENTLKTDEADLLKEINRRAKKAERSRSDPRRNTRHPVLICDDGSIVRPPPSAAADSSDSADPEWERTICLDSVDRSALDIEALLPYFTDREILNAAQRKLKAEPDARVDGINYTKRVT